MGTKLHNWRLAVKPAALPKILAPLAVGLAMGFSHSLPGSGLPWGLLTAALALAVLGQWCIVLFNDYADADADALHQRRFPRLMDRRVLTEGLWSRRQLLAVALAAAVALVGLGWGLRFGGRDGALWLIGAGLALLWAYSFAPLKFNYRGGGEALEAGGVGLLLPLIGYYLYTGHWDAYAWTTVLPLLPLALVGAVGSGLKHAPADRQTGKRTVAVWAGVGAAQKAMVVLAGLSGGWVVAGFCLGEYGMAAFMGAAMMGRCTFVAYKELGDLSAFRGGIGRGQYWLLWALVVDLIASPVSTAA
jgi:1,4-dihydroxy-2-naphthoate polyprenyltransferase